MYNTDYPCVRRKEEMKEVRTCIVCGNKFVKELRKDSIYDTCSVQCRQRCYQRAMRGQPISNLEHERYIQQKREEEKQKRLEEKKGRHRKATQVYADPTASQSACLCKRKDCIYRGKTSGLYTCDYILVTGKSRGCPVEDCDKYVSEHKGFT